MRLEQNHLLTLPETIGNLVALKDLVLFDNELASLPDSIGNLRHLTELDLRRNPLTVLPDGLGKLPDLEALHVDESRLISPPPAVVAQGTKGVLDFLRARLSGDKARQWRSKLLIVGQGAAGKTSLVKSLAGEVHDPEESTTHGLRVTELPLTHPDKEGVTMQLSIWDFGGQEIYHATHQFFLTDQSLFVLVWSGLAGWEHGRLRYWLDLIAARAPSAPIVLVATHAASRAIDLPLEALRKDFPQIRASFAVDNSTRMGIPELVRALSELAVRLPLMGQMWPSSWLAASQACRDAKAVHAGIHGFRQLLQAAGIVEPSAQQSVTRMLHQLGELLFYEDDLDLSDIVVLKP